MESHSCSSTRACRYLKQLKRYIIIFIDNYSWKTWVYLLVEKFEAFVTFKHYTSYVENKVGSCIKNLRTDRGGEFISKEFIEFCSENNIRR